MADTVTADGGYDYDWDDELFVDNAALLNSDYDGDDAAGGWHSDEGFPNYIPTAIDPGPYVLIFVCVYSVFLMLALPVMVVWGRRYEARKKELQEMMYDERFGEEDAACVKECVEEGEGDQGANQMMERSPTPEVENPQDQDVDLRTGVSEDSVEVGYDRSALPGGTSGGGGGDLESPPNPPPPRAGGRAASESYYGIQRLGRTSTTRSTVSGAASAVTTVSKMNRKLGGAFENFADRILIPHYQDDDPDYKSAVSGMVPGRGATTTNNNNNNSYARTDLSAATTSFRIEPSNAPSAGRNAATSDIGRAPRIVDAAGRPGAGRRRRKHRMNIGRVDMIQRAIESEERSEMMGGGGGGGALGNRNGTAAATATPPGAGGGRSEVGAGGGGKKMSGLANETMSGMMDDTNNDCGRSGVPTRTGTGTGVGSGAWNVHHGPASQQQPQPPRGPLRKKFGRGVAGYARSAISGAMSETPTVWKNLTADDITPNDAADADDPGQAKPYIDEEEVDVTICCGQWALWKPKTVAYGADKVIELAEPDSETRRIVRLGVPLTLSEMAEALFEAITVAVLSNFLGTNAVTAYVVVELLIGLTNELVAGIIDAEGTICSHAVGAGNNFLAGQYVQIAVVFYVFASIPFLCMWAFIMDDVIKAFGLNDEIARIGLEYTRVVIFNYLIDGVAESYGILLDITGHETFALIVDVCQNVAELCTVVTVVVLNPNTALATVGFIHLVVSVIFFVLMLGFAVFRGWLSAFWGGMLGSFAFKNAPAVKNVVRTAVPLSLGSFLEYGEWELLTFFAAYLGPAEVATWALLGTIWELFEACTEGLGQAAAIRVAYHLGKGNPQMARTSSYKSLLLAGVLSVFVTSGFFMCGYNLPTWFSQDATIQHMLADLIPLVGIGNITMTFGMVSWSLVGAQGRYRLATFTSMISSWLVTIPLGLIFVFGFNINLKGLVGSVIAGYSTSGCILSYILLRSDWERLSKIIRDLNAMTGEIDSSDSEDEDESSSSSSDSSSDDDDDDDDSGSESELESGAGSNLSRKHLLS